MALPRRLITTAHGSRTEAFGPAEWTLAAVTAGIWGSSFLFIATGLDAFAPAIVAFARVALGALTLGLMPGARRKILREDWPTVVLIGVLWMAVPFLLFPIAQQWVDSSVAGMINGAMPVLAAVVASILLRHVPLRAHVAGIAVGFVGVVCVAVPSAVGADASPLGVALLVLAVTCYAVASNLAVPVQQRYGSLPVVLRAQLVAVGLLAPAAVASIPSSSWAWNSAAAMLPLGILGTGAAFLTFTTLLGRAGAARGAIAVYLVPVVAVFLGVVVRDESVAPLALFGSGLVILGAWLAGSGKAREAAPVGAVAGR